MFTNFQRVKQHGKQLPGPSGAPGDQIPSTFSGLPAAKILLPCHRCRHTRCAVTKNTQASGAWGHEVRFSLTLSFEASFDSAPPNWTGQKCNNWNTTSSQNEKRKWCGTSELLARADTAASSLYLPGRKKSVSPKSRHQNFPSLHQEEGWIWEPLLMGDARIFSLNWWMLTTTG